MLSVKMALSNANAAMGGRSILWYSNPVKKTIQKLNVLFFNTVFIKIKFFNLILHEEGEIRFYK